MLQPSISLYLLTPPQNLTILEGKNHNQDVNKVAQPENRDGHPTSVVVSFGRAVGELSRKGGCLDHGMLADSWESLSHVTRKPVFGVSNQVRLEPAYSATETS